MRKGRGHRTTNSFLAALRIWGGGLGGDLPLNKTLCMNYISGAAPNVNQTRVGVLGSLRRHSASSRLVLQKLARTLISELWAPPASTKTAMDMCERSHAEGLSSQRVLCSAKLPTVEETLKQYQTSQLFILLAKKRMMRARRCICLMSGFRFCVTFFRNRMDVDFNNFPHWKFTHLH